MDNIKITMLGATSAGKTCFMLGMYAAMRQGVKGFTFTSNDMDVDLELSDMWEQLVDPEQGKSRWPNPNNNVINYYSFGYCYGLKRFIGFDWIDYRGGVLRDTSTAEDRNALLDHFATSDCIFICLSGEHLTRSIKGHDAAIRTKAGIDRMNGFFTNNLPPNLRPPVAIVITKSDLMVGRVTNEVINEIKDLFNPLFAVGSQWEVMITPVTLGRELRDDKDQGEIAPVNIHLPVTYAAFQAFKQELSKQQGSIKQMDGQYQQLGRSWFSRLWNKTELSALQLEMGKNQEWISQIEGNMKLLVRELMNNASTYFNGREIKLDT